MIAKVVIFLTTLVTVNARVLHHGLSRNEASFRSRQQDGLGNFSFGYNIVDGFGANNSRSEFGNPRGSKRDPIASTTSTEEKEWSTIADGHGFRPAVKTNTEHDAVLNAGLLGVGYLGHRGILTRHRLLGHAGLGYTILGHGFLH